MLVSICSFCMHAPQCQGVVCEAHFVQNSHKQQTWLLLHIQKRIRLCSVPAKQVKVRWYVIKKTSATLYASSFLVVVKHWSKEMRIKYRQQQRKRLYLYLKFQTQCPCHHGCQTLPWFSSSFSVEHWCSPWAPATYWLSSMSAWY